LSENNFYYLKYISMTQEVKEKELIPEANKMPAGQDNTDVEAATPPPEGMAKSSPLDRMKGMEKFKEKDYENSDLALNDALDALDELIPQSEEASKMKSDMAELFKNVPQIPYLIKVAQETGNFQAAIQSLYDSPEDMLLKEGDEGYDKVQEMMDKRVARDNQDSELYEKYNTNMSTFPQRFEEWAKSREVAEEEKNDFLTYMDDMLVKLVTGEIDEEVLDKMLQSYRYKQEIGDIGEDAAIAEANTNKGNASAKDALLKVPEGVSPKSATPAPKKKQTPLGELFQEGVYKRE
jgi:hypothetical protein